MYSIRRGEKDNIKKAKGVKMCAVKKYIRHERCVRSEKHEILIVNDGSIWFDKDSFNLIDFQ